MPIDIQIENDFFAVAYKSNGRDYFCNIPFSECNSDIKSFEKILRTNNSVVEDEINDCCYLLLNEGEYQYKLSLQKNKFEQVLQQEKISLENVDSIFNRMIMSTPINTKGIIDCYLFMKEKYLQSKKSTDDLQMKEKEILVLKRDLYLKEEDLKIAHKSISELVQKNNNFTSIQKTNDNISLEILHNRLISERGKAPTRKIWGFLDYDEEQKNKKMLIQIGEDKSWGSPDYDFWNKMEPAHKEAFYDYCLKNGKKYQALKYIEKSEMYH